MNRNHPDHEPDSLLLESARRILTTTGETFEIKPWRTIMTRVKAVENQKAMKAAQKKLGIKPPKESVDITNDADNCADNNPMVESGFSIFNQNAGALIMNTAPELKASPAQAAKQEAALKAIADKAAKKKDREAKAEQAKAIKEDKATARAAEYADKKAAREAKAAELHAAGKTYTGSMTQLTDRVKQGVYVKSMTGQLRSNDELAIALDAVPPANVVALAVKALGLDSNPYTHLNVGQQSMNLRNKMRGAIKKGTLSIQDIQRMRDEDGLATVVPKVPKEKKEPATV